MAKAASVSRHVPSPSVTAAFSPTERHVSVFFFRRQATSLVRYLKSVFFVMTFITVCWRGGYLGISKRLGKDKNEETSNKLSLHV